MSEIVLLDGGMGQELVSRSGDEPTPLWATKVMMDHPGLVRAIHDDYFAAGATVAKTNTYAIHHDRLVRFGIDDRFEALHRTALSEAKASRDAHGAGRIAGAIGPLGASYRPDLHPPHGEAVALYAEIARLLAPEVDLILCETVSSVASARAVLEGALDGAAACGGKPVWLAVTVDDEDGTRLRSGEPLAEICRVAADGASAVLANCSAPEAMASALEPLAASGLPFGAYANGFEQITKEFLKIGATVDALEPRRDMGPSAYADFVMSWIGAGATIVGGCCETGPAHIAAIARALHEAGHEMV